MKNKSVLLLLVLIFLLTAAVNFGAAAAYRQRNMQSYLAAGIDKQARLSELQGKRIILVGGSNVAFGFKSGLIEEATGRATMNMGLQGSLGLRFMLNSLKPYLRQGDTVLLSPEYNNFAMEFVGGDVLAQYLIISPQEIRYLSSPQEMLNIVSTLPNVHTSAIQSMMDDYLKDGCFLCSSEETVYYRQGFDQYGDVTVNRGGLGKDVPPLKVTPNHAASITRQMIRVLNDFSEYAAKNGIKVYLVYPATSAAADQETVDFLQQLDGKLRSELKMPILGTMSESEFPNEYMFNTSYHLNSVGAVIHSEQVIHWLCGADAELTCGNARR